MSFTTDEKIELDLAAFKDIRRTAGNLTSQCAAWQGQFDTLRAGVDAGKQAELDTKRLQFLQKLKTTFGL
tara:strand:- start:513 stop:722 length:210 start_codon:yes stop_codon:yes gene_type:complete